MFRRTKFNDVTISSKTDTELYFIHEQKQEGISIK